MAHLWASSTERFYSIGLEGDNLTTDSRDTLPTSWSLWNYFEQITTPPNDTADPVPTPTLSIATLFLTRQDVKSFKEFSHCGGPASMTGK